jgi:hypothetical protein
MASISIQNIVYYEFPDTNPVLGALITASFSIVAGFASWHLLERRFKGERTGSYFPKVARQVA